MTPDERNMLTDLAKKVAQTPPPPKDAEAEEFIRTQIGRRPDALYLMTQTVLIQNMALEQAQAQIQDLQQQNAQSRPAGGGSFLGSQGGYSQSSYAQPSAAPPPQYASQYAPPSGGPSFLRGAAQTAAGVAAGALAFEGIRSLFSHPGFGASGFGGGSEFGSFGGAGSGMAPEVVNNYYETESPHQERNEHLTDVSDVRADSSDLSGLDDSANINNADNFDDSLLDDDFGDSGGFDDNSNDV
ncbi:MAG TPA: DUF2076 domain-containing protein [Bryobacteraceae bacterium]|nr:DUF2076 domain-containing protein [Bryobacteraceae bacterium]